MFFFCFDSAISERLFLKGKLAVTVFQVVTKPKRKVIIWWIPTLFPLAALIGHYKDIYYI